MGGSGRAGAMTEPRLIVAGSRRHEAVPRVGEPFCAAGRGSALPYRVSPTGSAERTTSNSSRLEAVPTGGRASPAPLSPAPLAWLRSNASPSRQAR
jgi:hypothetical protein